VDVAWTSLRVFGCMVVLPAAAIGMTAAAQADDSRIAVRVDSSGRESCAEGQAFLVELEAKDPNVRAAGPSELAPLLVVRIARTTGGKEHGRLVIEDTDGTLSRREVVGDTCESVLAALALMAAIAVDPRAPLPREGVSGPSGSSEASPPTSGEGHETPARARAEDAGAVERVMADRDGSQSSEGPSTTSYRISFAGGAGVTTGTAPSVVPLFPVSVDVSWGGASSLGPMIRGGFEHAGSGDDAATGGGSARFVLNAGTLDACVRWPVVGRLELFPCLLTEAGVLSSTGLDIMPARSDTRPWVAVGALGTARYRVVWRLFAELSVGLRVPLLRDRYFFEPDTTVFRPPALAALGSGALGITIP
jgi:hypothetical protein